MLGQAGILGSQSTQKPPWSLGSWKLVSPLAAEAMGAANGLGCLPGSLVPRDLMGPKEPAGARVGQGPVATTWGYTNGLVIGKDCTGFLIKVLHSLHLPSSKGRVSLCDGLPRLGGGVTGVT